LAAGTAEQEQGSTEAAGIGEESRSLAAGTAEQEQGSTEAAGIGEESRSSAADIGTKAEAKCTMEDCFHRRLASGLGLGTHRSNRQCKQAENVRHNSGWTGENRK